MLEVAVQERHERPILYSAPMVPPVLAGTKTQTRRELRPQPSNVIHQLFIWKDNATPIDELIKLCPYGLPGDRLWVRETFFAFGRWETQFSQKKGRDEWHFIDMTLECGHSYSYAATDSNPLPMRGRRDVGVTPGWWKRPAIFMPRAASRILLEVTEVRVERLNSISEVDAGAEGLERTEFAPTLYAAPLPGAVWESSAVTAYRTLWESINGPGSWDANPWVWAVSFKRLKP